MDHVFMGTIKMTSNLLINEPPLQVLPSLAKKVGLNEAIVLQQVHYWLNPKHNKNCFNGRHWVWNTYEQWQEQFPFWSIITIRRAINSLEKIGILISYVDTSAFKNLKYYSINYDLLNEISSSQTQEPVVSESLENPRFSGTNTNEQIDVIKMSRRPDQNEQIDLINMTSSYKDTKTTSEITHPPLTPPRVAKVKNEEEEENFNQTSRLSYSSQPSSPATADQASIHQQMIQVWNDEVVSRVGEGAKNVFLTSTRANKLQVLLNTLLNHSFEEWKSYCQKISGIRFLMGQNNSGFKVNIDWALKPENALKVLEGAIYDRPEEVKQQALSQNEFEHLLTRHCQSTIAPQQWHEVCKILTSKLGQACFQNWLKEITPLSVSETVVQLEVKTRFLRDYISSTYGMELRQALKSVFGQFQAFEITVAMPQEEMSHAS